MNVYSLVMSAITGSNSPREKTRDYLLEQIRANPGITRSQLARETNISISTVGHAVNKLILAGQLDEKDRVGGGKGSGSGRPSYGLFPKWNAGFFLGLNFYHTYVSVGLADRSGKILDSVAMKLNVDSDPERAIGEVAALVEDLKVKNQVEVLSQGVACVSLPISNEGQVLDPLQVSNWGALQVGQLLERRLGIPVSVESDSMMCAYGEARIGAGIGIENFLYIRITDGIGAGVVLNGAVYKGSKGFAGDIGHIKVPGRQDLCLCGERGCLNATVTLAALRRQVLETHPRETNVDALMNEIDAVSQRIFFDAGKSLGRILADQARLLNPDAIILGGYLADNYPVVLEGVEWGFREKNRSSLSPNCKILKGKLTEDAELVSCIQKAISLTR